MSKNNRYFFYLLVFVSMIVALCLKNYLAIVIVLPISIALGLFVEFYDNRRDEKFKHYNKEKHNHKH